MKYFVISLSVIVLTVCSNKKISLNIDSCQILLTNEYEVNGSQSYGASSFLIKSKEDTLLCTAKHLLGEAMGISPEIKTDSFNSYDFKWLAYARNDTLSSDTFPLRI